jgi:TolB-like protein
MASIIEGYEYDIFISYRQKDNKHDGWVTEFVKNLKGELESTFKEEISVYFDINPHDGLLDTHDVEASLNGKLKCLIFVPIISRTYCDPKSFAWVHEFSSFIEYASHDQFGLKIKLPNGNVASRVLPILIHDLEVNDIKLCESIHGGTLRGVEFIYKELGVNRSLSPKDDERENLNGTIYRNQINKVALALKEALSGLKGESAEYISNHNEVIVIKGKPVIQDKSIIVLPFENLSPDPNQEYFSDGLTEEVISDLSLIPDLLVISRSSAMTFKGSKNTVKEIADKINVRYVLEGSVRKASNNLRITAQLIDSKNDAHIWAEKYNGTLEDIFDIQEKVSKSIFKALKVKLTPEENHRIDERHIDNILAFEYYLKARAEVLLLTEDAINRAIQYLNNAIEIIGDNALLLSGMAFAHLQMVNIGAKHDEFLAKAEDYARQAISLDPELAQAHATLGFVLMWSNPRAANQHLKRAYSINPNDVMALQSVLVYYVQETGKIYEASKIIKRLNRLDPLDWATKWLNGGIHFYNGDYDNAFSEWRLLYETNSTIPIIPFYYASTLVYLGQLDSACNIINLSERLAPNNSFTKLSQLLKCAIMKNKVEAFNLMTPDFRKTCIRDCTFSHHVAGIFSLLGEKDEALFWIENAFDRYFINWPLLSEKDLWLENIRSEERFINLMKRVKNEWDIFEVVAI